MGKLIIFFFLKKWANPGFFSVYSPSFQANIITIFTANQREKMSCPSSIQCWDLNSRPLKHESSPITTRPGLPPKFLLTQVFHVQIDNGQSKNGRSKFDQHQEQCDQIGRFIGLWPSLKAFGSNYLPKYPIFVCNFCKGVT